jgi:hypothetical protein
MECTGILNCKDIGEEGRHVTAHGVGKRAKCSVNFRLGKACKVARRSFQDDFLGFQSRAVNHRLADWIVSMAMRQLGRLFDCRVENS